MPQFLLGMNSFFSPIQALYRNPDVWFLGNYCVDFFTTLIEEHEKRHWQVNLLICYPQLFCKSFAVDTEFHYNMLTEIVQSLSHVQLLQPCGMQPAKVLSPWDFPGKNTGVGCHFLLQGIFPTKDSNPALLHCRQILYQLSYQRSP